MSKTIQVSDETHERLKLDADANYRSIGGHIEYLMDYYQRDGAMPRGVNASFSADERYKPSPVQGDLHGVLNEPTVVPIDE